MHCHSPLRPGIHPNVAAGKLFTMLILPLLRRGAGYGGKIGPVNMNVHVIVCRRAQGDGFVFDIIEEI